MNTDKAAFECNLAGVSTAPASLSLQAPAKINLYLGVYDQKDERGYHRVDSVMATISLADTLELVPAKTLGVHMATAEDVPMEHNTVYRAARALGDAYGREPAVDITITKRIPMQAGLGGPSADAAAALRGLCHLWGIDSRDDRVDAVARSIGADVPFFLYGDLAYCDGAGDRLNECFEPLAGMPVVLVKPEGVGVTARKAYEVFDRNLPALPPLEPLLAALRAGDGTAVPRLIANNLASIAYEIAPEIMEVVDWLQAQDGVAAAQVTGSGACSFAICDSRETAERLARSARMRRGWWSCATTMEKSALSLEVR